MSWLLFRSIRGFEFRAVGLNPGAARYAGMNIGRTIILTMVICGGLAGLAGTAQVLGPSRTLTPGFSPGWGFDGIAVALIGGSRPLGVVLAAFLFGALRAGATPMQAATGIPIDLVVVIQALVIMFVAAPALVRGIYRYQGGHGDRHRGLREGVGLVTATAATLAVEVRPEGLTRQRVLGIVLPGPGRRHRLLLHQRPGRAPSRPSG